MVERELPKLAARVRFPSPAPQIKRCNRLISMVADFFSFCKSENKARNKATRKDLQTKRLIAVRILIKKTLTGQHLNAKQKRNI